MGLSIETVRMPLLAVGVRHLVTKVQYCITREMAHEVLFSIIHKQDQDTHGRVLTGGVRGFDLCTWA